MIWRPTNVLNLQRQYSMFTPSQNRAGGAPEILDGAHSSAPRSWNNLRRWSVRKGSSSVAHQERSATESINTTPIAEHAIQPNLFKQQRRRYLPALIAVKHVVVFLAFSIPIVFLGIVCKIPSWYAFQADYWLSNSFTHCNFDGSFTPEDKPTLSLWNSSGFFYITVSWGKMAFSTAKFIDVIWDIVVGRGGQALLAFITFKVSSQYLATAMRDAPVSYNTFESLAFVPPSMIRTAKLARDLLTNRCWRARLIIVWIISSSVFVLSFSTLVTAMSGYSSDIDAFMPDHDNESVMWSNYMAVQFAINDAERIGLPGPLYITSGAACVQEGFPDDEDENDSGTYDQITSINTRTPRRRDDDGQDVGLGGEISWEYVPKNCTSFWRTVQYVGIYGLSSRNYTASSIILNGTTHTLAAPTLNITTSYLSPSLSALETYLTTFSKKSQPALSSSSSVSQLTDSTFWVYEGETYPLSYVVDNAICQYSRWHNWGFSFLFLFVTSLLLAIWSAGTYTLWLYTYLHGSESGQHTTGGIYKSSWTLVEAMKRDVGPGAVVPEMEEREIRNLVRRRPGRVTFGVGDIDGHQSSVLSENEKNIATSLSTSSPINRVPMTRLRTLRNWLSQSTRHHEQQIGAYSNPVNSISIHATSTFSSTSTSEQPILRSSAIPGRTMTMTSGFSSLAFPFTDSPPEFGFFPKAETDILNSSGSADAHSSPATLTGVKRNPRPTLSLARTIGSSVGVNYPRTGSAMSPSSMNANSGFSPGGVSPSEKSSSTTSPMREWEKQEMDGNDNERHKDEDAVKWRNDLGDD